MGSPKRKKPPKRSQGTVEDDGRSLSKQVLAAARRGSFAELMQVSTTLVSSKECFTAQTLDVLLCHFQAKVPTNMKSSTFLTDPGVQKCTHALMALHVLFTQKDAIVVIDIQMLLKTTWRDVFRWMQYFYTAYVTKQLGTPDYNRLMPDMLIGVLHLFLIAQDDCRSKFMAQTPGAARMATQLWIQKELIKNEVRGESIYPESVVIPEDALRVLILTIQEGHGVEILDEVVEAARTTGEGLSLPEILRNRMKFALDVGGESVKIFGGLLQLLGRLTFYQPSHPLRQALLESEMVPFVVKCLAALAEKVSVSECSDSESFVATTAMHGFEFICFMFKTVPEQQWILQALKAGFLEVFVTWSSMFPFFPATDRGRILLLLSNYYMPYLVFFPVLLASEEAIERMDAQKLQQTIGRSTEDVKDAWSTLVAIVSKRAAIGKVSWGVRVHRHQFVCDTCCKSDDVSNFKKCAGCEKVLYCSKACQVKSWKEQGHREQCKQLKTQGFNLLEKSQGTSYYKQVDAIVRDVARSEAFENIEKLRIMAKEQLPDVHIDDVGVEIEYDIFPPVFRVFARPECIRAREAREQGIVDIPFNTDFIPEPREYYGEKLWRGNKNLTLLVARIPRGKECVCHPYGIRKFWDGMSHDDISFDARVQAELRNTETRQDPNLKKIEVEGGTVFVNPSLGPGATSMLMSAMGLRVQAPGLSD